MSSTLTTRLTIFFISVFCLSCSNDEPMPAENNTPLRAYEITLPAGVLRAELSLNNEGRIARLDWSRKVPNETVGSDVYTYDTNGALTQLVRSITNLQDEVIVFTLENDNIIRSEHYVNGERLSYIFYDYDETGRLVHTEESNRVLNGAAHVRGDEREYFYNSDGNLSQIKEYSFDEPTAQLILETVYTFSNFLKARNPLQPIDVIPNTIFQKNLPATLTIESNGHTQIHTYTYTFRSDGLPDKRTDTVDNSVVATMTYEY